MDPEDERDRAEKERQRSMSILAASLFIVGFAVMFVNEPLGVCIVVAAVVVPLAFYN